ncbi:hypothetical protein ACFOHS_06600 [Jhaorihella thermophila]
MTTAARIRKVWSDVVLDLGRQFRWSFLPPLMVYFAAGASGLTAIVGTFFVKEYLDVSPAFLAGLAFWAGLPWALKMPVGHLVDLIWRWKAGLIWFGVALIAGSFLIMHGLALRLEWMTRIMPVTWWYVLSVLIAPFGYVVQDAVADAMSVEAVPRVDDTGTPCPRPNCARCTPPCRRWAGSPSSRDPARSRRPTSTCSRASRTCRKRPKAKSMPAYTCWRWSFPRFRCPARSSPPSRSA